MNYAGGLTLPSTKNIITLHSNCSRWESEEEDEKDLSKFKAGCIACVNVIEKENSWSEKDRDITSEVYKSQLNF